MVDNLANKNKDIQSDCIKVLYEIGAIKPELIAGYIDTIAELLDSRNNRLVWGAMTALGVVASSHISIIIQYTDKIIKATEKGSVITQDWGVRVLVTLAPHDNRVFPFLVQFLKICPAKDIPRHTESMMPALNATNRDLVLAILKE